MKKYLINVPFAVILITQLFFPGKYFVFQIVCLMIMVIIGVYFLFSKKKSD